ncbi:hypothetical protein [Sphingosinicella sp. BN140058]|uniref:hypothetical protein n=1 Tax=Sphingosinicella sp. BN140058 TaxID=1892855 RepID=UPI0010109E23|nr:hypothetical protein [Sphingosinicella sp. BN140058]QAY79412.1 hypothetical protein ETR14_24875 [Sphingosinicella sp. BN140058]
MTSPEPDTAFLLRRAEEEAILAIRTDQSPAAPAHYELAMLYSARALDALSEMPVDASGTVDTVPEPRAR